MLRGITAPTAERSEIVGDRVTGLGRSLSPGEVGQSYVYAPSQMPDDELGQQLCRDAGPWRGAGITLGASWFGTVRS
jgi:hypothetical protein